MMRLPRCQRLSCVLLSISLISFSGSTIYCLAPGEHSADQTAAPHITASATKLALTPSGAVVQASRWSEAPGAPNSPEPASASIAALPDAPDFAPEMTKPAVQGLTQSEGDYVPLDQCPYDTSRARECRVHWRHLLISTSLFNAFQNAGNLYTGYWYRWETTHGKWFDRWIDSAAGSLE
jgi:hypothetical protein